MPPTPKSHSSSVPGRSRLLPRRVRPAGSGAPRWGTCAAILVLLALLLLPALRAGGGLLALGAPEPVRLPVVLVPGWGDTAAELEPLRRRFVEAGWPEGAVVAMDFVDPVGSNADHAHEIRVAVERLKLEGEGGKVDVVAHSMGGLALRHYLTVVDSAAPVRRVVFMATPHRGTMTAYLAWGEGGREMLPGSAFLLNLNRRSFPGRVQALALQTPVDLRIIPASSAVLPEVRNLEICCPSHGSMLEDPGVFQRLQAFLMAP